MRSAVAERVRAREPERAALGVRATTVQWWSVLVVAVVMGGVAVWLISPRFELDLPSLEDDWSAIAHSPEQVDDVLFFGNPEEQRFRPGWILWNYVQWHTFDAPRGVVGPNAWNVARLLIFVLGFCLLTALALPRPRGTWQRALYPVLAGVPAALVLTVPKLTRDFARFGTQEPLLLGAMALGGSLLVLGARSLLAERPPPWWRVAVLCVAGSALWLVGVYQKESSVCALPLVAAVLFVGRDRFSRWTRIGRRRQGLLAAVATVAFLPFVHVGIEIVRITARGDLVYDAEVDRGRGVVRGVEVLWNWAHEVFSPDAQLVIFGAVALTALATVIRRRVDALAAGALASGALSFLFAAQSGVAVSRYYMPVYALFGVALALSLARLPRIVQLAGLAWLLLAFVPAPGVREEVRVWVVEERANEALVRLVTAAESTGCPVAVGGLDVERTDALPVVVGLERQEAARCERGETYVVTGPGNTGAPLLRTCERSVLERMGSWWFASVHRCGRLSGEPVRDPMYGLVSPQRLVELRRLRPVD